MNDNFKVVCGSCKCDPGLMSDDDGEVAVCPGCGQRDSVDDAYRIAGEHYAFQKATPEHAQLAEQTFRWRSVNL